VNRKPGKAGSAARIRNVIAVPAALRCVVGSLGIARPASVPPAAPPRRPTRPPSDPACPASRPASLASPSSQPRIPAQPASHPGPARSSQPPHRPARVAPRPGPPRTRTRPASHTGPARLAPPPGVAVGRGIRFPVAFGCGFLTLCIGLLTGSAMLAVRAGPVLPGRSGSHRQLRAVVFTQSIAARPGAPLDALSWPLRKCREGNDKGLLVAHSPKIAMVCSDTAAFRGLPGLGWVRRRLLLTWLFTGL